MTKKRGKNRNPQGTFTPDDVALLYLRLWELSDAIKADDKPRMRAAMFEVYGAIPNTTTNAGAFTRARNLLRKQAPFFDTLSDEEQIAQLRELWREP